MVMYDPMAQESYLPYTQSAQSYQIAAPSGTEQVSHSGSHEPEVRAVTCQVVRLVLA